jgi:L-alanine-DL-glutamate epimerase-like enolase superfamily enzyme
VVLHTDAGDGLEGHGFTFTIDRGTEVVCAAIEALRPLVASHTVGDACADMGAFWRTVTRDSQLRWIGPEKGVIHLATAAVVNAMWDLFAKRERKPLWKLLVDMSPEQLVALVDWRYLTDALTPDEAVALLHDRQPGRVEREARLRAEGLAAFDYVAVSGSLTDVVIECVDHLHEHFVDPVRVRGGRYLLPELPGYSAEMRRDSLRRFVFPGGEAWRQHVHRQ